MRNDNPFGLMPLRALHFDSYLSNVDKRLEKVNNVGDTQNNTKFINPQLVQETNKKRLNDTPINQPVEKTNISTDTGLPAFEIPLSNVDFGYNTETNDFYVKVVREGTVNQYPTDQMIRAKIALKAIGQDEND